MGLLVDPSPFAMCSGAIGLIRCCCAYTRKALFPIGDPEFGGLLRRQGHRFIYAPIRSGPISSPYGDTLLFVRRGLAITSIRSSIINDEPGLTAGTVPVTVAIASPFPASRWPLVVCPTMIYVPSSFAE